MSDVVNGAGWSEWSDSQPNTNDVLFGEYRNSGAGSKGKRASFATALNSPLAIADILNDRYKTWVDAEYLS
jgi:pectinesterase